MGFPHAELGHRAHAAPGVRLDQKGSAVRDAHRPKGDSLAREAMRRRSVQSGRKGLAGEPPWFPRDNTGPMPLRPRA